MTPSMRPAGVSLSYMAIRRD